MYQRYGLQDNPFKWVDPVVQPAHFLSVEGFGEQKPAIDNFTRGKLQKTHFFLVHGISGTGRTSVSNYIAHVYADGATPLKVVYSVPDSAHRDTLHQWMEKFSLAADLANFSQIPKYFENVADSANATEAKYTKFLYQSLAELQPKNRPLVAVFENVKNAELFELVRSVFDPDLEQALPDFPLIIFTSSDEDVSNRFGNLNPKPVGPAPIRLRALKGEDVLNFIDQKWRSTSICPDHPFDTKSIVRAFDYKQYPLKRAIEALNSILEEKVKNLPPAGDDWPADDRLRIQGEEIAMALLSFDARIRI